MLSEPADESFEEPLPVTLEWNEFENADHYELQLSKTEQFYDRRTIEKIDKTSITLSDLSDSTQFYWRVRATADEQKTVWSPVWSFTTEHDQ